MSKWGRWREIALCTTGTVFALIALVGFVIALSMASWESGYRKGWCESRGGYHISGGLCDIGGQVIKVDEPKD
jgi:hypothetical protein